MAILKPPISDLVWNSKYRYVHQGKIIDQSIEDTWKRVARAISQAEKPAEQAQWEQAFYQILQDFKFLPGGRILAGAGTTHKVTLLNCFVMHIAEDSLPGIFTALKEGALTLQQGGGVGYDFSVLRPHGAEAKKTGIPSSGPVSFMRIWDTTCSVLLSTGQRRGAMMGVMRCDHPDIEEFIAAKKDARELRHFNVSVLVTDAFMQAVREDADWALVFPIQGETSGEVLYRQWSQAEQPVPCRVYKRIKARELWNSIIRSAYDYAEPGVLFGDTINRKNNLWYCERINATNPCGEIPLPPYGACDLGAINLTQFVTEPFSPQAKIKWDELEKVTQIATRFLDNVLDVSHYPLPIQQKQSLATRRIGLGITGLGDMFVMLGVKYGSQASIQLAGEVMRKIANITWQTSIELAREKSAFQLYNENYLHGEFVKTLDEEILKQIKRFGIRNSHHNTIAPAGTISLLANNISNGIEPIFRAEYDRHVRKGDDESTTYRIKDYAKQLWAQQHNGLPPAWVDAQDLAPEAHLHIQAAVQPYIDNAISKTINIPRDFPFNKLVDVYTQAYELGLKGCTVFRPNSITGSVIEVPEEHCCQYEGEICLETKMK